MRSLTPAPPCPLRCSMRDALSKINDKSSNACMYIICICLLLGMAGVAFNMITKKK